MSIKTTVTLLKISTVTILSFAFALGMKYYDSIQKYEKLQELNKIDKEAYANDLKEILSRYDAEVQKNYQLTTQNQNKKGIVVENESKSVRKMKEVPNTSTLYLKKIDSFKTVLKKQNNENSELNTQVSTLKDKNRELASKNLANETIISTSKNLTAINVVANGVRISANNIIETKRFNTTEQVKVCFTLLENKAAIKGYKDIYIQILNPENKVVAKNGEVIDSDNKLLLFSAKTNVYYDNEDLDVCVFVDPNKQQIIKGDYEINIYSGINLIGSTVFSLK
ncbi:hypothetical protein EQG63_02285 [Flavobacterium amnicola]|uniref:Chromosome partitioning protein ParA n=1 Tax=Flavobacterium amnicola TaxID=2506422 RepID=A0A4Q1K6G5_9FLAO|nr:hypothetical protein [Flavobacterium amnicola]RXR20784.1 hypothetical protein EQG63_02285 [Flavobacterium amnicola]